MCQGDVNNRPPAAEPLTQAGVSVEKVPFRVKRAKIQDRKWPEN